MAITLSPDLQDLVDAKLRSGQYPTAGDVLRVALQLLDERDRMYRTRLEDLRVEIRKGLESGEPIDASALLSKLHAKGKARNLNAE